MRLRLKGWGPHVEGAEGFVVELVVQEEERHAGWVVLEGELDNVDSQFEGQRQE